MELKSSSICRRRRRRYALTDDDPFRIRQRVSLREWVRSNNKNWR